MTQSVRKDFIEKLKSQLDDLDSNIDEIEKKSGELKAGAQEEYERRLADLKEKRRDLDHKLDEFRTAGEGAVDKVKAEAERSWKALENSFKYFLSHYR